MLSTTLTPPSPAERSLMVACTGLAACGGILGCEALRGLQGMVEFAGPVAGEWLCAICAALGAIISGLVMRHRFGHSGIAGGFSAAGGALVATLLLGVVAGTFVLPIFGTMFGPWLVVSAVLNKPWLVLPWLLALYGLHLAMSEYRTEQDSIFRWLPRVDAVT